MKRLQVITAVILLSFAAGFMPVASSAMVGNTLQSGQPPANSLQGSIAENGINVSTEYPASNSSQAVDVTITISPTETDITNVTLLLRNSQSAFIDYDSFSLSLDPSGAAVVEEDLRMRNSQQVKEYQIDSLQTDETVTITFHSYPQQLQADDETLNVATVQYEFLRNGVEVPDNGPGQLTAIADISDSPQYTSQRLETRINNLWLTVAASLVVGILGFIVAIALYLKTRNSGDSISRSRLRSIENDAQNLQQRLSARGDDESAAKAEGISDDLQDIRR